MTVHLHTAHFIESGLSILQYYLVMLYEQRSDYSLKELESLMNMTGRSVITLRNQLCDLGILERAGRSNYVVTEKIYP